MLENDVLELGNKICIKQPNTVLASAVETWKLRRKNLEFDLITCYNKLE